MIVVPQVRSGRQHNYSTKTRQVSWANEQSMYYLMSMAVYQWANFESYEENKVSKLIFFCHLIRNSKARQA
jgi:hypothetical protein